MNVLISHRAFSAYIQYNRLLSMINFSPAWNAMSHNLGVRNSIAIYWSYRYARVPGYVEPWSTVYFPPSTIYNLPTTKNQHILQTVKSTFYSRILRYLQIFSLPSTVVGFILSCWMSEWRELLID